MLVSTGTVQKDNLHVSTRYLTFKVRSCWSSNPTIYLWPYPLTLEFEIPNGNLVGSVENWHSLLLLWHTELSATSTHIVSYSELFVISKTLMFYSMFWLINMLHAFADVIGENASDVARFDLWSTIGNRRNRAFGKPLSSLTGELGGWRHVRKRSGRFASVLSHLSSSAICYDRHNDACFRSYVFFFDLIIVK